MKLQIEPVFDKVKILMATYNGEKYLAQQIESLINQSYVNWELIIRDDGSSDRTSEIICSFKLRDARITVINDKKGNLRSCQNFSAIMESIPADSKYIMFCDQDDIWINDKIEKSLQLIKALERQYGVDKNLMVYGSYLLIDEEGNKLPIEVPDYSTQPTLRLLLSQNYIYGCTMMINKSLLDLSAPIAKNAENHDYWISIVAIINKAHISYIEEPLILYRQHLNNVSGSYKDSFLVSRIKRIFNRNEIDSIQRRLAMFISLYERFKFNKTDHNMLLLNGYINEVTKGGLSALVYSIKNKISRRGKMQTMLFYYNLLRTTRRE